jgi:hypothetical protein
MARSSSAEQDRRLRTRMHGYRYCGTKGRLLLTCSNLVEANLGCERMIRERYFRRRRVRALPSRFAFAATRFRYWRTILSPDAPAMRLAPAFAAALIFSLIINSVSRRAPLPPRINLIILNPITLFASSASNAKELNIRRPRNCRIANSRCATPGLHAALRLIRSCCRQSRNCGAFHLVAADQAGSFSCFHCHERCPCRVCSENSAVFRVFLRSEATVLRP